MKKEIVKLLRIIRIISLFGVANGFKYNHYYKKAKKKACKGKKEIQLKYAHGYLTMRTNSTDLLLVESMLIGKFINGRWVSEYNQVEEYIRGLGKREVVIIDAGANIGLFSRLILTENARSKIYAIEPEEKNYQFLKENTKNYNVETLKGGIWSHDCQLQIMKRNTGDWGFAVEEVNGKNDDTTINAFSIDSLIKKYNLKQIDLLKMDVEGSEYEIFNSNSLEWIDICSAIVVETHDHIIKGSDALVNQVLLEKGFSKFSYEENQLFLKAEKGNVNEGKCI